MSDQQINPGWASRRVAEGWDAVEILVEFWHTSDHGAFLDDAAREVVGRHHASDPWRICGNSG